MITKDAFCMAGVVRTAGIVYFPSVVVLDLVVLGLGLDDQVAVRQRPWILLCCRSSLYFLLLVLFSCLFWNILGNAQVDPPANT